MKRWIGAGVIAMIVCNNEVVSLAVLTLFSIAGFYCLMNKIEKEKRNDY